MNDAVRKIADAVLYEGYLLWPYRRTATKNQQRFTFGCIMPPSWTTDHPDEKSLIQTQCLIEGGADVQVEVTLRFLHVVRRQVLDADGRPVDALSIGGERYISWEEATEREITPPGEWVIPAGSTRELLDGGAIEHEWGMLQGALDVDVDKREPDLWRVTVRGSNSTSSSGDTRGQALEHACCSAHVILQVTNGAFVSPLDARAAACAHVQLWPVLVGDAPDRSTMLASAILLEEYPRIAPESPGDLFDGGEVDQLLTLNILGMTDEEKAEMRASDPRARAILERTEAMTADDLMRLHGAIRELQVLHR
jgi:hydrogenase maturation protease